MQFIRLVAVAMVLLPAGLSAAEGPKIDPKAMEISKKSAEFLASRPAISFTWLVSYDEVKDGREKLTFMRSGSNLLVRDKGFYSHVENEDSVRDYYFDGKTFTIAAPDEAYYAGEEFDGSFEDLIDAYREATGADLPLYALLSRDLPDGLQEGIDAAAYLGITNIAGREVHHLAFSDYDEDLQLWISTDESQPVPLVIIGTDPYKQGWPQYRAYLTNWDFDPNVEQNSFIFTPPSDFEKITLPDLDGGSDDEAN